MTQFLIRDGVPECPICETRMVTIPPHPVVVRRHSHPPHPYRGAIQVTHPPAHCPWSELTYWLHPVTGYAERVAA